MSNKQRVQELINFIDASPSPWHAVATMENTLQAAAFKRLSETEQWQLEAGGR